MAFTPFRDGDAFSTFRAHMERLTQEIRGLENSYVLRTSPTELEQYFFDKAHIEPLKLHTDDYHIEDERSIQVDATRAPNEEDFIRSAVRQSVGVAKSHCGTADKTGWTEPRGGRGLWNFNRGAGAACGTEDLPGRSDGRPRG